MALGGGMSCVKYLLFCFNLLFAITGMIILIVGAKAMISLSPYIDLTGENFYTSGPVVLIIVGVIVFIVAFFGCCGAVKENHCMIITFSIFLLVIFVAELAVGIAGYVKHQDLENSIIRNLNATIKDYPTNPDVKNSFDIIQTDLKCCGIYGPGDWKNNSMPIPDSCCSAQEIKGDVVAACKPENVYQEGCYKNVVSFLNSIAAVLGGVGLGIAAVQLLGVIFACCLARSIRSQYETALHYLQNVCNHPKLVLTGDHPEAARVAQQLAAQNSSLHDIHHAAKLPALKQLLLDCGIGTSAPDDSEAVVSQHRALIFCQLKKMLDIVEQDLLKRHLPGVTYLRLDGSVPPHQRHAIVTRFNSDVSIDLLLLTTAVGGLGLNLTGADTVVFVEHDWNPMKDAQAMDRAHRIGQRKVVNVYRLITRGTLEEKIMGLQKFKLQTANTVISSENAAMETMGTDQLLDLFQLSAQGPAPAGPSAGPSLALPGPSGPRVIEALPDLWDDKQYEEEYDMSNFIKGLNKITGS